MRTFANVVTVCGILSLAIAFLLFVAEALNQPQFGHVYAIAASLTGIGIVFAGLFLRYQLGDRK